jgi:carbon monoxide dehydrogenase subunit G
MTTVKVSTQVAAPIDQVFRSFTDIERAAEKVSGIRGIEMVTPGPFGPGTKWREIRDVMGHLDSAMMEVTSFDRNRMYVITHHKGGARIDTTFSFEAVKDGTIVSIEFNLDSQGMPPGLLSPLGWAISGKIRDVLTQDLDDLKASAEKPDVH